MQIFKNVWSACMMGMAVLSILQTRTNPILALAATTAAWLPLYLPSWPLPLRSAVVWLGACASFGLLIFGSFDLTFVVGPLGAGVVALLSLFFKRK